ncbi:MULTISPECIES: helix-turn-helix domain-containing protein [Oerskovia]|uniref:AraC family transcriptional regulator n=1 Tax=Oerskovia gallyi TaxID=2762226 RepID=A0ABR8UXN6_9CELL|nr:helix-turn-helix domain-containing protein [Oerskovia gallyi]MBD7997310.1 AraC family transcriptional regulator [Oerskovia gallyi]
MGQHYVRASPTGPLGSAVGSILGYEITDEAPSVHRGLPSPWLTFVISLDGPVPTATGPGDAPLHRYSSLVGGLHLSPAYIHQPAHQEGVQLALDPLASRALLGVPPRELGMVTDADDVLGPLSRDLRERVGGTASWDERLTLVAEALRRQAAGRGPGLGPVRVEVAEAWRHILRRGGRVSVPDVAAHVWLSPRQLTSLFSAELGLSPGAACRLVRFDAARDEVRAGFLSPSGLHLADVAARTGYADHSHLVRDFHAFAGLSPTAWLAEERANIQAGGGAPRAG